jgi:acetolactate synthase I/II/III large subunit
MPTDPPAIAAQRLLQLAAQAGVDFLFTNLGSDHPAFIEALARLAASGAHMPRVVVCPHEMSALSAAHGYAMITRRPQMVLVHVDVGTQNLGGSVHNAARGRIPALIVAGLSPVTDGGARTGTRNEFIHYIQDTPRQQEIVGQYMKWSYELRAAENVDAVLLRALQIAASAPQGPVYLTGAREVWDSEVAGPFPQLAHWPPAGFAGIAEHDARQLHHALCAARRPIVVSAYLGRQPDAVARLTALSERIGIGVCEVSPQYVNFPGRHPHHLGYRRNAFIDEADLILMLDVDVPWINSQVSPAADARLYHIDQDALKTGLGYWHFAAHHSYQADSLCVLEQLLAIEAPITGRDERLAWIAQAKARSLAGAAPTRGAAITPEELTEAVGELVNERSVVLFEAPSCTELIPPILRLDKAGSFFHSGGSGLGFAINGAIGAKLARPDAEVIALVGDGCFLFGVPGSAYWMARTYRTPYLTVIYNNGGWRSPKLSTQWVHPSGTAARNDTFWVAMGVGARLADLAAAAGDAHAERVSEREALRPALHRALEIVRKGRCAVVEVMIEPVSQQMLP